MEETSTSAANNVARAIVAALDWSSSPDSRAAAVSYLESVKAGDIRVLANTSFLLVKKDWSSEIRLHALKMLQHVVRLRWEEFSSAERRNFANVAVNLMSEIANPSEEWVLKSQTSALVAEMVRREGLDLWKELFPSLVSISNNGSIQAELVAMILRWLPEDITVHNEDLEGDRRRLLLRGLTESLPDIFPLLYTLLERHFGAAMSDTSRQQIDIAKQHAAAVTATLHAINAYAEWAPLPDLLKYGIIHGCSFLLSSPDFRIHACEFFKLISSRRRPVDSSASDFDLAVTNIFQILMNVSRECLHKSSSNGGAIEESEFEFVESICESLVSLGSSNLHFIASDSTILPEFIHQMLGYFQHYKLAFHYQALLFWMVLMRYAVYKPKIIAAAAGDGSLVTNNQGHSNEQADSERRNVLDFIKDDICNVILDISFQRLVKRETVPGYATSSVALELWSDDFEGKGDYGQYRSKLLELIRIVAIHKPLLVATRVSDRIISSIQTLLISSRPSEDLAMVKSMQLALENVVNALFYGPTEFGGGSSEIQLALCKIFEGLLQQLLSLKWTEPDPVEILTHYLEVLGPFLKYFPDGVGPVINKLFELLTSLPHSVKDPSTSKARYARLQICSSFIRIAKTADKSLLPHMKGMADTMAYLQGEGRLLRAEHNLLGEAFLIMASSAGVNQQQEVLAWLLEPLSKEWTQPEWQNAYLSDPTGLVRLCAERPFMWSLFHTVTFFEKALKRSGVRKGNNPYIQNTLAPTAAPLHPLGPHLVWMLPPLLKLLRAIHSLWSPPITQALPGNLKTAMAMSEVERTGLLGEVITKSSSHSTYGLNNEGVSEPDETDIRNWLKGIRDSGYNVLGLSATIGDSFFKCLDNQLVTLALVENVQSMEFRHIRQLVHSVLVPIVKFCPSELQEAWLEKILHPLFLHSEQALRCSWSSLLQEGRAKVPDVHGIMTGSDLKVEVMEEKLLRALTREICSLLSVLASPALNTGLPSIDQSGYISRIDTSSLKDLDSLASSSMVRFILKHKTLSHPALQICLQALKWTDGESVARVSSFFGAVVLLAIFSNNVELQEFVCKDMFYAIIEGLALESNAFISADLVGLCREIFIYLSHRDPAPRQILLSLPCITPHDLAAFEEALTKTSSPKEQKQHMKSLLLLATGNKLKALAAQKTLNVITNVTTRARSSATASEPRFDETGEPFGLTTILQR